MAPSDAVTTATRTSIGTEDGQTQCGQSNGLKENIEQRHERLFLL